MTGQRPVRTIGFIGGGQLARMMALEARRLGYRVGVLDPASDSPGVQVADFSVVAAWDDAAACRQLAELSDVLTLDTEHVPFEVLLQAQAIAPVAPNPAVLRVIQDRWEQRRVLNAQGAPQVRFASVVDASGLGLAARRIGFPSVLKTARGGYDGRGQARVSSLSELEAAWRALGCGGCVIEEFIDFACEISVVLARSAAGEVRFFPIAQNEHNNHVLHRSVVPAAVDGAIERQAKRVSAAIAAQFDYRGVMAVEFFVTRDGGLLVNEIAPRVHNSGHFTLGACATSQFEQHVRAICSLPLGPTTLWRPAVMFNLLGDAWAHGEPDWAALLRQFPQAQLHLYGKSTPRPGRKMGHLLLLADDEDAVLQLADRVEGELDRLTASSGLPCTWTAAPTVSGRSQAPTEAA